MKRAEKRDWLEDIGPAIKTNFSFSCLHVYTSNMLPMLRLVSSVGDDEVQCLVVSQKLPQQESYRYLISDKKKKHDVYAVGVSATQNLTCNIDSTLFLGISYNPCYHYLIKNYSFNQYYTSVLNHILLFCSKVILTAHFYTIFFTFL